jgi:hypothetical protein
VNSRAEPADGHCFNASPGAAIHRGWRGTAEVDGGRRREVTPARKGFSNGAARVYFFRREASLAQW